MIHMVNQISQLFYLNIVLFIRWWRCPFGFLHSNANLQRGCLENTKWGLELTSMKERVELSGGSFDIESIEEKRNDHSCILALGGSCSMEEG